jgi:hypothetical protein
MTDKHRSNHITRRDVLIGATAGAISLVSVAHAEPGPLTRSHVTPPDWYWRPMRWFTLNMTHHDPGRFDPDFWLDYLRRCHVDAAAWNSGGIVAFYPTKIPFHHRARDLGDSDILGYLIEGCRKMGMVVTNRVDHSATYEDAAQAHPEWIRRDIQGRMVPHSVMPGLYETCVLGAYNEQFMTEVMKEIVSTYRVDGFNHNRWSPREICYCEYCKTAFYKFSGMTLPAKENASDPSWGRFQEWRDIRLFELWDHWNAEIRKINPNAFVLPGVAGEMDRFDMSKIRARAKTLYLDYQCRTGLTPPYMAGMKGKEIAALIGTNPVGITFEAGTEDYRWKETSQSPNEVKLWVSTGVAHGLRPKFAKASGVVRDRRWLPVVEELYTWQWKNEKYLRNVGYTVANVAIVHSQATVKNYSWPPKAAAPANDEARQSYFRFDPLYPPSYGATADDAAHGIYHALVEARIPCDIVHASLLNVSDLERFAVLILPNVSCLSSAECEQIRAFVRKGGSLIATSESSLYDNDGTRRKDFALSDLFGVRCTGPIQGPMLNSYLRVNHDKPHPLLAGLDGADQLSNGVYRVPVEPTVDFPVQPLFFVAPYPDNPMEEFYPRDDDKRVPELFVREIGRSRIVYFPFDVDRTFWEILNRDHGALIANAVRWAAAREMPVSVTGKGMIDVAAWRQKDSMTVHLVNLTNPMMMKPPIREIFPVSAQRVRLRLPDGAKARAVKLLTAGIEPPFTVQDSWLEVTVPSVEIHEVVAVDLQTV